MNLQDLQPFCGDETHPTIEKPFSQGDWTYATNGRVCIRIPRLPDQADDTTVKVEHLFNLIPDSLHFDPVEADKVPPAEMGECGDCKGSGNGRKPCSYCNGTGRCRHCDDGVCPDCEGDKFFGEEKCPKCQGSGKFGKLITIHFHGATLDCQYLRQVATLPGASLAVCGDESVPLRIKFDGGDGLLMPLRTDRQADYTYPVNPIP